MFLKNQRLPLHHLGDLNRVPYQPYTQIFSKWTCEPNTFPWTYTEKETSLILEGNVTVTPDRGKPISFGVGDLVVFSERIPCTWYVHKAVRKHYRIGH